MTTDEIVPRRMCTVRAAESGRATSTQQKPSNLQLKLRESNKEIKIKIGESMSQKPWKYFKKERQFTVSKVIQLLSKMKYEMVCSIKYRAH